MFNSKNVYVVLIGIILVLSIGFYVKSIVFIDATVQPSFEPLFDSRDENTSKIIAQSVFENNGHRLVKEGKYELAVEQFKMAWQPQYLVQSWSNNTAISQITKIYMHQGKLDDALQTINEFPDHLFPKSDFYKRRYPELLALIEARDTNSKQPIYDYIEAFKLKYEKRLPPHKVEANVDTDIVRLYDYLQDYDNGLKFVEEVLNYPDLQKPARTEYLKIKQAFEQDKAEGTQGRPTQVIIKSGYLPW